jgi:hypothetical protein
MAITFVAKGTGSTVNSGTNTVAVPAGVVAGDLLVLIAEHDHTNNIGTPSGWVSRVNVNNGFTGA